MNSPVLKTASYEVDSKERSILFLKNSLVAIFFYPFTPKLQFTFRSGAVFYYSFPPTIKGSAKSITCPENQQQRDISCPLWSETGEISCLHFALVS